MAKQNANVRSGVEPGSEGTPPEPIAPPIEPAAAAAAPPPPAVPPEGLAALKIELEGKLATLQNSILKRMPSLDGLRDELAVAITFMDENPATPVGDVLGKLADTPAIKAAVKTPGTWGSSITLLGRPISDFMKGRSDGTTN